MENDLTNIELRAIGAARGIIFGNAYLLDRNRMDVRKFCLLNNAIEKEVERFEKALAESKRQLQDIIISLSSSDACQHLYVLEAHKKMLDDPMVEEGTKQGIRKNRINAEWALVQVLEGISRLFEQVEDDYLRERAADVDFIGQRLLRNLAGKEREGMPIDATGMIIVAHDLSPADIAQLAHQGVTGIATDLGGRTGHTAIMARSLGIPTVVGLGKITRLVTPKDPLILDGTRGVVVVKPDQEKRKSYQALKALELERKEALTRLKDIPAITTDGKRISLLANLDLPGEFEQVMENGAEGIGLFRTEYMFLGRQSPPTENEHFEEYLRLTRLVDGKPITLRTYDLGGEKLLWSKVTHHEPNPALGVRGVRFTLRHEEVLIDQLKAMYRAAAHGKIKILFPMVSGLGEWRQLKDLAGKAVRMLEAESREYDKSCPLGPMIEIPSAAIISDQLAKEADFLSLGTNDLVQYMLATDRDNELVSGLYEPLHPAILRILKHVIDEAAKAHTPLAICGEMAGDPFNALVLLGLGLEEFSMTPNTIPVVKNILINGSKREAALLASELIELSTAEEVAERVKEWMAQRYPELS
ncbi:MAG: phosphoenolpyruvate--protein phosphotransferase [Deltaproteobacteria bacterium]|nr:phosphoenolpyruvate--protein phosphotransferase [Deltaproteobacteria bacterium]